MKTPLVRAVRLHKTLVPSTMANPRCFFSLQISTSSEFLLIRWCTGSTCSLSHQLHSPLTAVLHHIWTTAVGPSTHLWPNTCWHPPLEMPGFGRERMGCHPHRTSHQLYSGPFCQGHRSLCMCHPCCRECPLSWACPLGPEESKAEDLGTLKSVGFSSAGQHTCSQWYLDGLKEDQKWITRNGLPEARTCQTTIKQSWLSATALYTIPTNAPQWGNPAPETLKGLHLRAGPRSPFNYHYTEYKDLCFSIKLSYLKPQSALCKMLLKKQPPAFRATISCKAQSTLESLPGLLTQRATCWRLPVINDFNCQEYSISCKGLEISGTVWKSLLLPEKYLTSNSSEPEIVANKCIPTK